MRVTRWVAIVIVGLFPIGLTAAPRNTAITLNATVIEIDTTQNTLVASGEVRAVYRKYTANADYLEYNSTQKNLILNDHIQIQGPSQNYVMDHLEYNGTIQKGRIQNLKGRLGKLRVTGESMTIANDKLSLKNATITGCDWETPDYIIQAHELHIYPQWGFFVAFDNWVRIGQFPALWVPTFIYCSRDYSLIAANASVPEIGGSQREGGYIRQRFGYFFDKSSNGSAMVGYAQLLGPLIGVTHLQTFSDWVSTQVKVASNGSDGVEYAGILSVDLIPNEAVSSGDDILSGIVDNFNRSLRLPTTQLKLGTTYREQINDSRVSKPYFSTIEFNHLDLPADFGLTGYIGYSQVQENTLEGLFTESPDAYTSLDLGRRFQLSDTGSIQVNTLYFGNWYSRMTTWQRLFGRISYLKIFPLGSAEFSYTARFFSTTNQSPFEFERKYAIENNELGTTLMMNVGDVGVGTQVNYDLDTKGFRTLDFIIVPQFHCWRLPLRWKTIEGQFSFGVELL
jgi:hypothetical protein